MHLRLHHLHMSRSTRIIWLLEELGLDYERIDYHRDPVTRRAPDSLRNVHPLGKAPVLEVDGVLIAESGAIIEYLLETLDDRQLAPTIGAARAHYLEWMHFAEGSAMLPVMLNILGQFRGGLPPAIAAFEGPETAAALGHIASSIKPGGYLLASGFSAADIQIHYVVGAARWLNLIDPYPELAGYLDLVEARPAYRKAIEIGGPVFLPRK